MGRFSFSYQFRITWTQRLVDLVLKTMRTTFISKIVGNTTLLEVVPLEEIAKAKEFMRQNLEEKGDSLETNEENNVNNTTELPTASMASDSAEKSSEI